MMNYKPLKHGEFPTPQDFFDKLNEEFHFTLDPCATKENAKCRKFFTKEEDGLKQDWSKDISFMNPPYNEIKLWIEKAFREFQRGGGVVVCLIPSRTDTRWWHEFCMKGEIRFVKGRLKFGNGSAPFPSAVIIFRRESDVKSIGTL